MSQIIRDEHPWRAIVWRVGIGLAIFVAVVWIGRVAGQDILVIEQWIADLGVLGPIVFLLALVAFTSLFFPDTLFAILAGAVFGLWWGSLWMWLGAVATASLNYVLSRRLLRQTTLHMLDKHPQLAAIERAASREGFRLMFVLRLAPISPVAVSYMLGASGVRFGSFLLACFGMAPGLFIEVYFGYLASHMARVAGKEQTHQPLHTAVIVAGFLIGVVLLAYITRMARRALAEVSDVANPAGPDSVPV